MEDAHISPTKALQTAVNDLSLARSLDQITTIVRHAARQIADADGATFVLREGGDCYYVDEEAIAPLWKGQRFSLNVCIGGWVMTHHQPVVIPDIDGDARIPYHAYQSTFVRSLAVVPIRKNDPLGAIGVYWRTHHHATNATVQDLMTLAQCTALALEYVNMQGQLERLHLERAVNAEQMVTDHDPSSPHPHVEELVRMCAWTQRLYFDGEWVSIEDYLYRRFDIHITHGISEDAVRALDDAET